MSATFEEATLAELVAQQPGRARIFEAFGLDYCCGGKRTLAAACAENQIKLVDVCNELRADQRGGSVGDEVNWAIAPLPQLIEHIVSVHHAYLRRELPRLSSLLSRVAAVHGGAHPELREVERVFRALDEELTAHMWKEEHVLFPWIEILADSDGSPAMPCGSVTNPIRVMEHEHQDAADALARMRALTGNYQPPADACGSYVALLSGLLELEHDLHRHVHKENHILFPRAAALENRYERRSAHAVLGA